MVFRYFKRHEGKEKLDRIVDHKDNDLVSKESEDECIEKSSWHHKVYNKLKGLFKVGNIKTRLSFDNKCLDCTAKYITIKPEKSAENLKSTLEYLLEKSNGDLEKAAELADKLEQQFRRKYGPSLSTFDLAYHVLKGVIKYDSSEGVIFIDKERLKEIYGDIDKERLKKYSSNLWFRTRLIFRGDQKGKSYSNLLEVLKELEKRYNISYKGNFNEEHGVKLFWAERYFKNKI